MALAYVNLPRLVMAILVGGTLGTISGLFQQLTQNHDVAANLRYVVGGVA